MGWLGTLHLNGEASRDHLRRVAEALNLRTKCHAIGRFKFYARDAGANAQLSGRTVRDDLAAINDADLVSDLDLVEVVRGENHGGSFAATNGIEVAGHRSARLRVKANGRLVEEEHLRLMQQRAGNLELSTHAARVG